MLGRKTKLSRKQAGDAIELARQLAGDRKFRKQLASALRHTGRARGRTQRALGLAGTLRRLAGDEQLRRDLREARADLLRAYGRVEKKTSSHKLRNVMLVAGVTSLASAPQVRERVTAAVSGATARRRGGGVGSLADLTKEELYERAQKADIPGRSEMSKDELIDALRAAS